MCVRSLQHSPDGEPRRQSDGKVFERVDHQVDPAGHTRNRISHVHAVLAKQCRRFSGQLQNGAAPEDMKIKGFCAAPTSCEARGGKPGLTEALYFKPNA